MKLNLEIDPFDINHLRKARNVIVQLMEELNQVELDLTTPVVVEETETESEPVVVTETESEPVVVTEKLGVNMAPLEDGDTDLADIGGPADTGELDKSGMPWDARIHAKNKSKTAKGDWKKGRNLDADFVKQVEAEIRPAAPAAGPHVATAGPPSAPPAPASNEPAAPPEFDNLNTGQVTWPSFLAELALATQENRINSARQDQLLEFYGVSEISQLNTRPELWSIFLDDEHLGIKVLA